MKYSTKINLYRQAYKLEWTTLHNRFFILISKVLKRISSPQILILFRFRGRGLNSQWGGTISSRATPIGICVSIRIKEWDSCWTYTSYTEVIPCDIRRGVIWGERRRGVWRRRNVSSWAFRYQGRVMDTGDIRRRGLLCGDGTETDICTWRIYNHVSLKKVPGVI